MTGKESVVVLKFGGTSVSTRERWETIGGIARERLARGERPFIVCSALSGVSNLLERVIAECISGSHAEALAEIRAKHAALCESLGLDLEVCVGDFLADLDQIAHGAHLLGEVSPRVHARVMSLGELMSTTIGAAFLDAHGLPVRWRDARQMLRAVSDPSLPQHRHFLSAECVHEPEANLRADVLGDERAVTITQGFIASDDEGHSVLLGRGGSDTSAAYFAAKLTAVRCEIWTDVPGMFTADPRRVSDARHLRRLGYDEAQEIASTGAKVLHPRCIAPCMRQQIPIEIKATPHPSVDGTVIATPGAESTAGVKAISTKTGITLVSMDSVGMWQQVGFLSNVFACFKRFGLSVDLVSTSETNVTVSLDPGANVLTQSTLDGLIEELREYCEPHVITPCTAISLVGRQIRSVLHRVGPALALFEDQRVHLITQAANDLNFTIVVDTERAPRMVVRLHELLFHDAREGELFGSSWDDLFGKPTPEVLIPRWWQARREELLAIDVSEQPAYVYDLPTVRAAADRLTAMKNVDRVWYAMKANSNADILRVVEAAGLGFECVSQGEIEHLFRVFPHLDPSRVFFSPNFAPRSEFAFALERGVLVNLDNTHPLREWGDLFRGRDVVVRIDPGSGRGHHDHVRTGGRGSKFGVDRVELRELVELTQSVGARVVGLHAHAGSGILSSDHWFGIAQTLIELASAFPDLRFLNLGGGLGVVERSGQLPLDVAAVDESLIELRQALPDIELWIEPGRYLVAEAGVLLASVCQIKQKGEFTYVGVNAGMHTLIRPALYGAWHRILNLSRIDEARTVTATVVGPICESGDTLGYDRRLPETREGDTILVDTAGAYGAVMSSDYNLRPRALEIALAAEVG